MPCYSDAQRCHVSCAQNTHHPYFYPQTPFAQDLATSSRQLSWTHSTEESAPSGLSGWHLFSCLFLYQTSARGQSPCPPPTTKDKGWVLGDGAQQPPSQDPGPGRLLPDPQTPQANIQACLLSLNACAWLLLPGMPRLSFRAQLKACLLTSPPGRPLPMLPE